MVEFVMTFLVVAFVFFLLFECSMWIYTFNVMSDAAKAGVRYAIVHGSRVTSGSQSGPSTCASPCVAICDADANAAAVITEVNNWASFSAYSTTGMNVSVCYLDGTNVAPNRVRVSVTAPITPYFGAIWSTPAITAKAEGRIVN